MDLADVELVLDFFQRAVVGESLDELENRSFHAAHALTSGVLRIGTLRVYYEVSERPESLVTVRAVGVKDRNRVTIAGEEIDLS